MHRCGGSILTIQKLWQSILVITQHSHWKIKNIYFCFICLRVYSWRRHCSCSCYSRGRRYKRCLSSNWKMGWWKQWCSVWGTNAVKGLLCSDTHSALFRKAKYQSWKIVKCTLNWKLLRLNKYLMYSCVHLQINK